MTKTELSALQELNMSPDELEQRRREVEAKLHAEPNGTAPTPEAQERVEQDWVATSSPGRLNAAPINGRKKRSDAGVPKGPKLVKEPAPSAAVISAAQAAELKSLAEAMIASARDLADAQRKNLQAAVAYAAYVDALTK